MSVYERRLKNGIKRILKKFPQYERVENIDDADIAVIFTADTYDFYIITIDPINKESLKKLIYLKVFYLKHTNPRNRRQLVSNDVGRKHFLMNR